MSTQTLRTPSFNPSSLGLSRMPREQRDTLFTLATLFFILIPHFFYLPIWASGLAVLTLLLRTWLTKGSLKLPGTTIKVALLILFVGLTLFNFRSIAGPEAGGTLLVMLTSLKTLELRARRDALVIFYLGFFLMMLGFFQSQSILTAVAMLIALVALLSALVNAHMPAGYPTLSDSIRVAVKMMLWGMPLMLALFLTFPRFDPLWAMPSTGMTRTGVTDTLSINDITRLAHDSSVAFRVTFEGQAPDQKDLYFRGPVLSIFDGTTWHQSELQLEAIAPSEADRDAFFKLNGSSVAYEVTMEATNQPWLFTLDITPLQHGPRLTSKKAFMTASMQWMASQIITERIRYSASAYFDFRAGMNTPAPWLESQTRLPVQGNPRTRAWAQQLLQDPAFAELDAKGKAQWLLEYIYQGNYHYTLTPPAGFYALNAADQLWFDYKAGFCEHYAFAFAVLMRSLDIPTRIVTGYQGAEPNLVDSYWIVRQSNAHAWTEIWQENEGWIRIDPTNAIAPERINNGSMQTSTQGQGDGAFANLPFLDKLLMQWDALENSWNQWVLSYNTDSGIDILKRLGLEDANWWTLVKFIGGLLVFALLLVFGIFKWRTRNLDLWKKTYVVLRSKLAHAGFPSDITTGPRTLALQLQPVMQTNAALAKAYKLLLQMEKIRYTSKPVDEVSLKDLRRAIRQLHIK